MKQSSSDANRRLARTAAPDATESLHGRTRSHLPGEEDERDVILLIHGTFAGRATDGGDSWWQYGSPVWRQLGKRLPAGARISEPNEVFHWSGDNSERARIKAGYDLLERLLELESAGRKYHLIGHSHGGSVIWHTLRHATRRRKSLDGLRSWTTVGTPFLHYRTRGAWSPANVFSLVLSLVFLKPALKLMVVFAGFVLAALMGWKAALHVRTDQEVGVLMATLRAPLLKLAELAGVPLVATGSGLRLGSYDPASGDSVAAYLFMTWEGWVICLIAVLGSYVFLLLASFFLNPVCESLRIRAEKRLERNVMAAYRGRWLGLWSSDDEAINGLRATLDLSVSFVSQLTPREPVLLSDYLSLLSRPYFWLLAPAYNSLVRPTLDRAVRSMVVKTAQGNNRPAAEVIAVSPLPVPAESPDAYPALPVGLNASLLDRANRHARDIAPKLRELLSEPSFVAGLERFGAALSGQELIHTSYFDHPQILDLLALHVAWARRDYICSTIAARLPHDVQVWFREFKHSVHESFEIEPAASQGPQTGLVRPRRRQFTEQVRQSLSSETAQNAFLTLLSPTVAQGSFVLHRRSN